MKMIKKYFSETKGGLLIAVAIAVIAIIIVTTSTRETPITEPLVTQPSRITQSQDTQQPTQPTTTTRAEQIIEQPKEIAEENNQIILQRKEFIPSETSLIVGNMLTISIDDKEKFHKIACYNEDAQRISLSGNLNDQESANIQFDEVGNYICVDAIFGARLTVDVKPESSGIIGYTILATTKLDNQSPLILLLLIGALIIVTLNLRMANNTYKIISVKPKRK